MSHLKFFLIFGLIFLLHACSPIEEKPADIGLKYFPLAKGNVWIYDVTEIAFDTLTQNDISTYQEKYEIADDFMNQLNERTYVIHLSTRTNVSDPWTFSQTWSAKVSTLNEVIVTEENVPYIKMILPVSDKLTWKGNKYNTIEIDRNNGRIDNFEYVEVKKSFGTYANTITVQESDDLNFAYKDLRYSTYADNVGLVYRVNTYIDYCDQSDCFGLYIRKHERTKIQTLFDYAIQ